MLTVWSHRVARPALLSGVRSRVNASTCAVADACPAAGAREAGCARLLRGASTAGRAAAQLHAQLRRQLRRAPAATAGGRASSTGRSRTPAGALLLLARSQRRRTPTHSSPMRLRLLRAGRRAGAGELAARRRAAAGARSVSAAGDRRVPHQHPAGVRGGRVRESVPGALLSRAQLQSAGAEGACSTASPWRASSASKCAAQRGSGAHGDRLRRRAASRRPVGARGPRAGDRRRSAPEDERMKIFDPARPHDVAHDRRLRGDGGGRHPARSSSRRSGSASRAPASAASSTTSTACSAGSASAPRSSASVTSARSGSTRRRPTTRRSPTRCSTLLPRFLDKDGVVAVGEIGFDDQTEDEEACMLAADSSWPAEFELPVLIHTPHRDKKRAPSARSTLVSRSGSPKSACSSTTTTRRRCRSSSTTGCWAGHTIYPNTKMDEQRMAALVKKYGSRPHHRQQRRRLGHQRSAEGAEDDRGDARAGHRRRRRSQRIVWDNPVGVLRAERPVRSDRHRRARRRSTARRSSRPIRCCAARAPAAGAVRCQLACTQPRSSTSSG